MPEPVTRRPIAARGHPFSRRAAASLAAWGVPANAISLASLGCALAAGLLLALATQHTAVAWLLAALLIELRLLCNMLDGMVALQKGQGSRLGALFNEVPDRFADIAVLVGLGYAPGGSPWLGFAASLGAVMTAYVRAFGEAQGQPPDFRGPFAKPQRMQAAALACLLCFLLPLAGYDPLAWSFPGWPFPGWSLPAWALALILLGTLLTVARRLLRLGRALS
jgi:phosphatidylglycerophosphate synthase